jgi:aspartate/methionine/tyrosine aminotransferase
MDLAGQIPDCIHLEVGEPGFPTPPHIVEAAARAGWDGFTKYTPSRGYLSLREALSAKLATTNALSASPEDIIVTTGAVTALFEAMLALLEPGDTVLLPDPGWPNTEAMVLLAGGRPVRYRLEPSMGYEPDPDELERLARDERPRVIYVNSPSNPTGAVFRPGTIDRMCAIAEEVGAAILSDECYEAITFGVEHRSPAALCPDRVFTAFSFSKTYAMTGWRVGYLVTPPGVAEQMTKVQEPIISCATGVSQKAAEAALTGPQDCVAEMVAAYRERRDLLVELLEPEGVLVSIPQGAFYAMVDVSASGMDARSFAECLLRERSVAVAPGDTFGESSAGAVRVSLASHPEALTSGVARLIEQLHQP